MILFINKPTVKTIEAHTHSQITQQKCCKLKKSLDKINFHKKNK